MKDIKIWWTCKCGHEFELGVSPTIPAMISGPPESCYPEEGGELDTLECPECSAPIDEAEAQERADAQAQALADNAADNDYQERKYSNL